MRRERKKENIRGRAIAGCEAVKHDLEEVLTWPKALKTLHICQFYNIEINPNAKTEHLDILWRNSTDFYTKYSKDKNCPQPSSRLCTRDTTNHHLFRERHPKRSDLLELSRLSVLEMLLCSNRVNLHISRTIQRPQPWRKMTLQSTTGMRCSTDSFRGAETFYLGWIYVGGRPFHSAEDETNH